MRTHIFNVEVKDFLHECGGHRDHHDVAPVLTEGPHHNHPDIPENYCNKTIFKVPMYIVHVCSIASIPVLHVIYWHTVYMFADTFPNMPSPSKAALPLHKNLLVCKNASCTLYILVVAIPYICTYLFLSMSRRSRKTLPERSFSLLTGSNDRLERIKSFSWTLESSSSSQLSSCMIMMNNCDDNCDDHWSSQLSTQLFTLSSPLSQSPPGRPLDAPLVGRSPLWTRPDT